MKDEYVDVKVRVWKSLEPELYERLTNVPRPHKRGTVMRILAGRGLILHNNSVSNSGMTDAKHASLKTNEGNPDSQNHNTPISHDIIDEIDIESAIK